jgi:hypothetical protein
MNKGAITRFCGGHGGAEAARSAFYLLLAALIAVELTRSAFQAATFFRKPDPVADVWGLDSFSEPALAAAILKQRAESCFAQARNAAWDYDLSPVHDPRQAANGLRQDRGFAGLAGPERGSPPQVPWLAHLEELRATIQDLNIDLDQKLLVIYSENRLENQFLDRFLQLLCEAPNRQEVLDWAPASLECSLHCGRTEELEDALRHLARFHPNLKTTKRLAARVQAWEASQRAGPSANDR